MRLGIDPGCTGALALISGNQVVKCWDMPVQTEITSTGAKRNEICGRELYQILGDVLLNYSNVTVKHGYGLYRSKDRPNVYVERQQHNMGKGFDSPLTAFTVGKNYGIILACVRLLFDEDEYRIVHPVAWKTKAMLKKQPKVAALDYARKTLDTGDWLLRKKDIGRADAMLIAYHGE